MTLPTDGQVLTYNAGLGQAVWSAPAGGGVVAPISAGGDYFSDIPLGLPPAALAGSGVVLLQLTFTANDEHPYYTSGTIAVQLTLSTRQLRFCSSVGARIFKDAGAENVVPYACSNWGMVFCADGATREVPIFNYADTNNVGPGPVYASVTFSAGSLVGIALRPDLTLAKTSFFVIGTCTVTSE